jgi:hypothetical protein
VEVEEMWLISANHRLKLQKCHEGQRKMTWREKKLRSLRGSKEKPKGK